MKKLLTIPLTALVLLIQLLFLSDLMAQNVAINADGSIPHDSAILDLQSSDKGLLIPRMDAGQRDAIIDPAPGLMIYQTGYNGGFRYFDGVDWRSFSQPFAGSVADVDGNVYEIVEIGTQNWFARNLEVTRFLNGDPIPYIDVSELWAAASEAAMTAYNGMPEVYVADFGMLYNAFSVDDPRGLCPEGWRVPKEADWQELHNYLGEQAGGGMKSVSVWESPNEGASNDSGFSAVPSGQVNESGISEKILHQTAFWSSGFDAKGNQVVILKHNSSGLYFEPRSAKQGLSVRCLKNGDKN